MIAVLLADGFEEVEALTPVDMLRRGGFNVKTVGIGGKIAVGSHKIPVVCDLAASEVDISETDMVILPGGMPGTLNLGASEFVKELCSAVYAKGGRLCAICAAPSVLGKFGYLKGRKAVCYPGFEKECVGADICDAPVVTDEKITTAKGMGSAFLFGKELLRILLGEAEAERIASGAMEPPYAKKS